MTNIELSDSEALLFRRFMEHHDTFEALVKAGLPEMSDGTLTLHFDSDGQLRHVDKARVEWRSRRLE